MNQTKRRNKEKNKRRGNSENKGKHPTKHKTASKAQHTDRTPDREEMDQTELDWEDGGGNNLRESPREPKPSQAHNPLET